MPSSSAAEAPDVVVVATGARPRRPAIEVLGKPVILDAWQVIEGAELPPGASWWQTGRPTG